MGTEDWAIKSSKHCNELVVNRQQQESILHQVCLEKNAISNMSLLLVTFCQ